MARVEIDGKQFALAGERFTFRGVTYGTFEPRADGHRFPMLDRVKTDFEAMNEAGFSVVRTYTAPPEDVVGLAADWGLKLLAGAFWLDWRYLVGASRRDLRNVAKAARRDVRQTARRLAGSEQVLALVLGNEIPADVVRWVGTGTIADLLEELADVVREEDPSALVTYANYPTTEYLPLDTLDFLTFNVFLERRQEFRSYLSRLQTLAGNRPLVLGEVGLDAGTSVGGEAGQAEFLDWQLEVALERGVAGTCVFSWTDEWWVGENLVEDWHFGLTRADRSPRPALDVVARRNRMTVADLRPTWPRVSVVICAYNAAETLDECLRHTCALDYPDLEILVVDDGSTDETGNIARRFDRARLVPIEHGGLSTARNEGFRAATGEVIAYLDSDAYPSPEWPYYLVLGLDRSTVGGVGGPNVPPVDDPVGAQVVARSPGGPVHVLLTDDRAEHVPGCNMAFWRNVLAEVGGFDPVYNAAGDDVDVCWKVLDRRWEIAFHPAALVWHHRRPGLRRYLRQQRGYGRAEALVEARHPDRFSPIGTARWRGRIYNALVPPPGRQRVYHGPWGTAAYQSIYQGGGYALDIAHQVGVPAAAATLLTAPLAALAPVLALPAVVTLVALAVLGAIDAVRTTPPRGCTHPLRFRLSVAVHHLLQPMVRSWGRRRGEALARIGLDTHPAFTGPVRQVPGGVLLVPADRPRAEIAAGIVGFLRLNRMHTWPASEWEACDAHVLGSSLVVGDLVTTSHPEGAVQVRVRPRLRTTRALGLILGILAVVAIDRLSILPSGRMAADWQAFEAFFTVAVVVYVVSAAVRGWWRTGPGLRRRVRRVPA
jgi:glycosyltransferase involved in cell wall biosynthesis